MQFVIEKKNFYIHLFIIHSIYIKALNPELLGDLPHGTWKSKLFMKDQRPDSLEFKTSSEATRLIAATGHVQTFVECLNDIACNRGHYCGGVKMI